MKNHILAAIFFIATLLAGCSQPQSPVQPQSPQVEKQISKTLQSQKKVQPAAEKIKSNTRHHFTQYDDDYRFSAELNESWQIEYIPSIKSINIYDPSLPANSSLEQSQIFIRKFSANTFLTLNTVTILKRENTEVHGHEAVHYEIEKKPGVSNFPQQPTWRNKRHKLTDIRHTKKNPSIFYVIAYNPELDEKVFEKIITSIIFDNDRTSLQTPIPNKTATPAYARTATSRITKKPFGIFIEPATSPVQPERFQGFHTGVDFEALPGEAEIPFFAFCGGTLKSKQQAVGYGGVVVQACNIEREDLTALYGHIDLASVSAQIGDYIAPGSQLGFLGDEFSEETDGERKHLHFSLYRGGKIDLRGYVKNKAELARWINPITH